MMCMNRLETDFNNYNTSSLESHQHATLHLTGTTEEAAMAVLRVLLFSVLMVTAALAKPVNLSEADDQSSESTEEKSSEEDSHPVEPSHHETLQPANTPDAIVLTEPSEEEDTPVEPSHPGTQQPTNTPDVIVLTEPQGTAAMLPSLDATISPNDVSVLPDHMALQTSTVSNTMQPLPADPSQTAPGTDIFQDSPAQGSIIGDVLPVSEVTLDAGLTETHNGTNQPQATATYREHPLVTAAPALSVPMATAETTVPVCITFQFATSGSPDPPRGDSMRRK